MEATLLWALEKRFNFRANLIDGQEDWGTQLYGEWTGMMRQVVDGVHAEMSKIKKKIDHFNFTV